MNNIIELKSRIDGYLMAEEPFETISLIEDEIEDVVEKIINEIGSNYFMHGNGVVSGYTRKGYIITSDNGTRILATFSAFKGENISKGDRVQYNTSQVNENKCICLDFMKCQTLADLKYHMFSCIENFDMVKASSYAWAIYDMASESHKKAMKLCIHTLRNYMRKLKKEIVLN